MKHITFLRKKRLPNSTATRGIVEKEQLRDKGKVKLAVYATVAAIASFFVGFFYFAQWAPKHLNPYFLPGVHHFKLWLPLLNTRIVLFSMQKRNIFILTHSLFFALSYAMIAIIVVALIPTIVFISRWIIKRRIPTRESFKNYSFGYKLCSLIAVAILIIVWLTTSPAYRLNIMRFGFNFTSWDLATIIVFCIEIILALLFLSILILFFMPKSEAKRRASVLLKAKHLFGRSKFGLYIGQSTGTLIKRHHKAGIAGNQSVVLRQKDAAQNIIILGGLGEGKTTAVIKPLLIQLLDQDCGGLVFDIKGSFSETVKDYSSKLGKKIVVIGSEKQPMNILEGLKPETAAEYLRSTLTLHGSNLGGDRHWLNAASRLATSVLGILTFVPEHYTLLGFHDFVHDGEFREKIQRITSKLKLDNHDKRVLDYYTKQYETAFEKKYEKYKDSVESTINEVLTGFAHPDVSDYFCATSKDAKMPNMFDILNGTVFLVDMPLEEWGMNGNVIYMLLKLRYFDVVKQRMAKHSLNQERPVFFMCDEYQRIIDRSDAQLNSDFNFWDKAREAKNIGIISSQSISSFYSAIGNHTIAEAIMQNFRQKICMKTEDRKTIESFEFLLGKVDAGRRSYSQSEGLNKNDNRSSRHEGETESLSYAKESVVDSQVFRLLEPDEAIASLSIGRRAMDDIVKLYRVV